ncbi:uncharacterized protein LOC121729778 [Aricia agestis]|uniref:uncharacterized protein LOC121729778 n=1 Tax=Aricia agestis TaxID=91739 RepID=UPI001C20596D|nr:uncharacterized protein LOC121729778 [Aricia agestis]
MRGTICVELIINTSIIFVLLSISIEAKRPPYCKDYRYESAFDSFYKLHHTAVDWHRARIRCEAEGTELVVPESLDEATALMLVISPSLSKFEGVFIGVHDIYAEGVFVTINGDFFANTFMELLWEQLQPMQGGGRCVGMRRNGKLFVHDCLSRLPFVCKKRAPEIVFYPDCVTYDKRWVLGPNSTCYMMHTEQQTWYDAFDTCAGAGGYLATLDSKNETDYIASLFNQVVQPVTEDEFAFLGFNDLFLKFHYRTIFGDPLNSHQVDWDIKCPDEDVKAEERCGGLSRTGLLRTSSCDTPAVFFCEKPANDSSAVQMYTTATTDTATTFTEATTPTMKRVKLKKKLRNLDTSYPTERVILSTTKAVERPSVDENKPNIVEVLRDIDLAQAEAVSINKISPKGDQRSKQRHGIHVNKSHKSDTVLRKSNVTKAANNILINAKIPNKSVKVFRSLHTTQAVDLEYEDVSTTAVLYTDLVNDDTPPALTTENNVTLPTIETKDDEDTSPKGNMYLLDKDISTTVNTYLVNDDTSTLQENIANEDMQTEESLTQDAFLQPANTDDIGVESS